MKKLRSLYIQIFFHVLELGECNLIFGCTGSWDNYFRTVGQQNNNIPQFKGPHIEK